MNRHLNVTALSRAHAARFLCHRLFIATARRGWSSSPPARVVVRDVVLPHPRLCRVSTETRVPTNPRTPPLSGSLGDHVGRKPTKALQKRRNAVTEKQPRYRALSSQRAGLVPKPEPVALPPAREALRHSTLMVSRCIHIAIKSAVGRRLR